MGHARRCARRRRRDWRGRGERLTGAAAILTIVSANGWFRATVADADEGVTVTWYRKTARGGELWRLDYAETIDAPFHLVCSDLAVRINTLQPEFDKPHTAPRSFILNGEAAAQLH